MLPFADWQKCRERENILFLFSFHNIICNITLTHCGGPVDLEFAARQSSWPRTESRYFQTSAEDIYFCKILMTKCIQRIRDLFEYALYKFTLYLPTYLLTYKICSVSVRLSQVVSVAFDEVRLEGHSSCSYDSVSLYDGSSDNSRRLGRYCNYRPTSTITSSGSSLFVAFRTDSSVNSGRFALNCKFDNDGG